MKLHPTVFVILGLVVFLAIPSWADADTIHACYNTRNGEMRHVDDPSECRRNEEPLSWNTEGPAGEPGPPGPPGPQGPPGPPGSIDPSKIYISTCAPPFAVGFCQCGEEGEIALSATVSCDPASIMYVKRAETDPLRAWVALCHDDERPGEFPAPWEFSVTCLKP